MQLGVDVTCMHTSFGGRDPSGFGDMATFQKRPNFPYRGMDYYSPWSVEKFNRSESAQKMVCMQVLGTSTCMNQVHAHSMI